MSTKEWLDDVAQSALSSRATLQATYDAACSVIRNGVPGDFVECGVWAGANSAAMARAILDQYALGYSAKAAAGVPIRVHLFDSFEGIPQAGEHDTEYLDAGHAAGLSSCSIETTQQQMKAWGIPDELLVYHKGWFVETIPFALASTKTDSFFDRRIALLRLDGDLYESTKVSLELLYPLVSPGGIVMVDDWVLSGCRKACQEYFGPAGAPGPISFIKES